MLILPVSARWQPPETGQSTAAPPLAITCAPRRFTSASSVVDISIQIFPGLISGSISSTTAALAAGLGKQVITDNGANQVRMSVVTYNSGTDTYSVRWSEVRGPGPMSDLVDADVATAHAQFPILQGGQELILVESTSTYSAMFEYPGLNDDYTVNTRTFTGIRFASQLCWEGSYCG